MKPLRVLIVDDTPIARDIMEGYVLSLPSLTLAGKCKNALEAYNFLAAEAVDVLLLDINMPEINGINLVKTLKDPPLVIFTTAYTEFAVESYELHAVDYLLKPVSLDRFMKAIDKVVTLKGKSAVETTEAPHTTSDVLFVKVDRKLVKIDINKLWLIEGDKVYTKLWIEQSRLLVYSTMKNIESQLLHLRQFVRVSKSFIINIRFVTEVDGNCIKIKDREVIIGNTYRDEVKSIFDEYKLL